MVSSDLDNFDPEITETLREKEYDIGNFNEKLVNPTLNILK